MFSEKKSTNKRPVAPCWWTTSSTASSGKPFQQSILRSPVATHLIWTWDIHHKSRSHVSSFSGFFNPSNIHLFKTEQGSIRLWCKYIWYTYILSIHLLRVYEFTVYIYMYIYIYSYIWPLHTHVLLFFSHVSWKTVLVKEDMVRQCRVWKITYPQQLHLVATSKILNCLTKTRQGHIPRVCGVNVLHQHLN